jgi:hypothetical protein
MATEDHGINMYSTFGQKKLRFVNEWTFKFRLIQDCFTVGASEISQGKSVQLET